MRKELDEKLYKEFPSIFRDRNASPVETPMAFGFDCGDGWYDLIRAACLHIDNEIRNAKANVIYEYKIKNNFSLSDALPKEILQELKVDEMLVVAEQVKGKFGTLRFYWREENLPEKSWDRISGAVEMVEFLSGQTCETCGEKGDIRGPGWLVTACDEHSGRKSTMFKYGKWVIEQEKAGLPVTGEAWSKRKL